MEGGNYGYAIQKLEGRTAKTRQKSSPFPALATQLSFSAPVASHFLMKIQKEIKIIAAENAKQTGQR